MLCAQREVDVIVQQLQESAAAEKAKNQFVYNQLNRAVAEKQKDYDEVTAHSLTITMPNNTTIHQEELYMYMKIKFECIEFNHCLHQCLHIFLLTTGSC